MEITEASLRQKFTEIDTEDLIKLREDGGKTDMALDVIESILSERGVSFSPRSEIESPLSRSYARENNLASVGSRFVAQIIDTLIALFVCLPLIFIIGGFGIIALILYILFQDGLPGGQSIGKRFLNIAVIDKTNGEVCGFGKSFVRNFLLVIFGIIDSLFIFSESRQRLGDRLANTIVVNTTGNID